MIRPIYFVGLLLLTPIVCISQSVEPTPDGDINGDGVIDWNDLYILAQHWQMTGNARTPTPKNTISPTPSPTLPSYFPGPATIRLEGEQVEGAYRDTFYEQVTISWDSIPGFDIQDASNYYEVMVEYIEGGMENYFYFSKHVDDSTQVILNINDSDFEPLGFSPTGYYVYIRGVIIQSGPFDYKSLWSERRYFNLIRRPTPTPTPSPTITVTPTGTWNKWTYYPAPKNIRVEGEWGNEPGWQWYKVFYNEVRIKWDPVPEFEVENTESFYRVSLSYPDLEAYFGYGYIDTKSTEIVIRYEDSILDEWRNLDSVFIVAGITPVYVQRGSPYVGETGYSEWFVLKSRVP